LPQRTSPPLRLGRDIVLNLDTTLGPASILCLFKSYPSKSGRGVGLDNLVTLDGNKGGSKWLIILYIASSGDAFKRVLVVLVADGRRRVGRVFADGRHDFFGLALQLVLFVEIVSRVDQEKLGIHTS